MERPTPPFSEVTFEPRPFDDEIGFILETELSRDEAWRTRQVEACRALTEEYLVESRATARKLICKCHLARYESFCEKALT